MRSSLDKFHAPRVPQATGRNEALGPAVKRGRPLRNDAARDQKPSKITISFALDANVIERIRKQAESERSSLNAKVNAILEKYARFFAMTEQDHAAIIPRSLHQFFINEIDEGKYTEQLKIVGRDYIAAVFARTGLPRTLDNVIKFTFSELNIVGNTGR